jgi:hypothetical protein
MPALCYPTLTFDILRAQYGKCPRAIILRQMPYAIRLWSTDFRHFYARNMAMADALHYPTSVGASTRALRQMPYRVRLALTDFH